MIANDEQLAIVRRQAALLEDGMLDLVRTVRPHSEQQFRTFAEGWVDQIRELRQEIDEYLGIADMLDQRASDPIRTVVTPPRPAAV